uniref:ribosomal protein L23 n=1 Tax=Amorphophallus muelleri TaxID=175741 RepID=UPI0030021BE4|nr:ribosomal protein L23 [Amorphophallus muelleri]WRP99211.1 ribosomal protein L23 [Amorphophallus muelleri]
MDGIKYAVFTEKSIRLLGNNQYTSNVESGSTRTEIKHWLSRTLLWCQGNSYE